MYVVDRVCDSFVIRHVWRMRSGYCVGYCDLRKGMARCAMMNEIGSPTFRKRSMVERRLLNYFMCSIEPGTFAFCVEMFGQKEEE